MQFSIALALHHRLIVVIYFLFVAPASAHQKILSHNPSAWVAFPALQVDGCFFKFSLPVSKCTY